ncbi:hypothetical protein V5O48_016675 [Marasmius crinis-equi]|uniref:Acyl-CoA desaturase n=1 Tax=Marasmius crinis-equi TaxID=585013 RepID=A0ABR3ER16_9AGAR
MILKPDATNATQQPKPARIWWSNGAIFCLFHLVALIGVYFYPPAVVPTKTFVLCIFLWKMAGFGLSMGYHRLFSYRAYTAGFGLRAALAFLGASAFEGSIKRYTDDPVHDPYAATRGLFYSHMGWMFYKPEFERLKHVDGGDLERDPVVRFQHKYYVRLAMFSGLVLPTAIAYTWGDAKGGFLWAGVITRLAVWHCTFLVNSLAHWDGLQPYSDNNTSRGNLIVALLTCGEGNHNFHAFPYDYRSGPSAVSYDPSKWILFVLEKLGAGVKGQLRRAREEDIRDALEYMDHKNAHGVPPPEPDESDSSANEWTTNDAMDYIRKYPGRCLILVQGWVLDVTEYLGEHVSLPVCLCRRLMLIAAALSQPGGNSLLRSYSLRTIEPDQSKYEWKDATWAFEGGLNCHTRAAIHRMREYRVARLKSTAMI